MSFSSMSYFGANILDTAQDDANWPITVGIIERCNMREVTVVEATHGVKTLYKALDLKQKHPELTIFYRKWRDDLHDEDMQRSARPDEWVRYFSDGLKGGLVGAVYNEALLDPMTPLTQFSTDIIKLTAPEGWATVHFKVPAGNPGGYAGEYLLPADDPHYRSDGYGQSDDLWRAMQQYNKPRVDAGKSPLVYAAPHAYFPPQGLYGGLTNRHEEIYRRATALGLDARYLPISIGEAGLAYMWASGRLDAERGFLWQGMDGATYANLFADVAQKAWLPNGITPHLFSIGQSIGGARSKYFDVLHNDAFWRAMYIAVDSGKFWLPKGIGGQPMDVQIVKPQVMGTPVRYRVESVPDKVRNVRADASSKAADLGDISADNVILRYPLTERSAEGFRWQYIVVVTGNDAGKEGWMAIDNVKFITSTLPVVIDSNPPVVSVPTPAPDVPPPPEPVPPAVGPTPPPEPPPPPDTWIGTATPLPTPAPSAPATTKIYLRGFEIEGEFTAANITALEMGMRLIFAGLGWMGQATNGMAVRPILETDTGVAVTTQN